MGEAVALDSMAQYAALKHAMLRGLTGRVLEIGAGYGANFDHFGRDVAWLGLDPARSYRRLCRSAARYGRPTTILRARAERIPLADASLAAVVGTVVLCSVADQSTVLAEVLRVLRPGGRYLFFEHVAAPPGTASHRLQTLAAPLTRRFDHGCDPTRHTWRSLEAAGFAGLDLSWFGGASFSVYSRYIAGTATKG